MKTSNIIILVIIVLYLIGGYILYLGWPRTCKEGQTSNSIDPVKVNDAIKRDCESVWSHYYPSNDQADRTKWTQLVIDLAISGRFNCWDSSDNNNLIVTEIVETSNAGCNTGSGGQNEKSLNIASMISALGGTQTERDIYRLNAMTQEQRDVVEVKCADCSLSMKLDTNAKREEFNVDADDKCLVSCDADVIGCASNSDECWGPCHGVCGTNVKGIEYRQWIMNTAPGSGGRQCTNLAPTNILDKLTPDSPVVQDRQCTPDTCPGCCETNTGAPLDTCNQHTGLANHRDDCITQVYNGKPTAEKECQWSIAGAEADGKFFADDGLCMYMDVVQNASSAVIDNGQTTADQPYDMKCRWRPGSTEGRCLPSRSITEAEEVENRVNGKGETCTNDSLYKDFSDTCQNGFDINNPNPSKIFALKSSGWRGVDEDPTSISECATKSEDLCNEAAPDCRWVDPHDGSCEFIKPSYMKFNEFSGTEAAFEKVCKDQHAINSYIQTVYNEMNGTCEFQTSGLRISLTSIPNYGAGGTTWDSTDGAHGWLWTNFDNGGAATMAAANELINNGILYNGYILKFYGHPILQEHPLIDGDTGSASSYNVNHYSVWIPGFSITGNVSDTTTTALKTYFNSNSFKDAKGRKIVVSNLDTMQIKAVGEVSYTTPSDVTLPPSKDGRIVDQRQCMIEGSVLKWRSGGADGDHPVIDGTIWKPADKKVSVTTSNHSYNCEPLPGVESTGDDSLSDTVKSVWWETEDPKNESNKFSGFMNPYQFSKDHPSNDGSAGSKKPSYLTKQVAKLGGVRCMEDTNFVGKECRAKRWDLADFNYTTCSNNTTLTDCNGVERIAPICNWEPIEDQTFDTDDAVKEYCAGNV